MLAVGGIALAAAAPAQAAPIRECGRANYSVRNVTTRNLNCSDARRMAKSAGFNRLRHQNVEDANHQPLREADCLHVPSAHTEPALLDG
jgi:hypothetical protein